MTIPLALVYLITQTLAIETEIDDSEKMSDFLKGKKGKWWR